MLKDATEKLEEEQMYFEVRMEMGAGDKVPFKVRAIDSKDSDSKDLLGHNLLLISFYWY
jgi:hypothetical protein